MPTEKAMQVADSILMWCGDSSTPNLVSAATKIDAHTEAAVNEAVAEYKRVVIKYIENGDWCGREELCEGIEQLTKEKNV